MDRREKFVDDSQHRQDSLRRALVEFERHYHRERNHQGLDNNLIEAGGDLKNTGKVRCRERLGGMLRYYYREAA